ncbi:MULTISPECIES: ABC transporter ATP-binding protein [unclassified Chelatococcus]|uniref:ABC transporter ATP-binding protein n=1 Tax=unclassified Chelatococcus TaxID=2638111 RepID=UPI001BCD3168|nr:MULTISPECIES: ABC transporter ATP-binding protein [unclassified Chelatococcus]MBS7700440.1 ABC transporter ATP-binding protein [Chelatococcus sp. YT9]MBX3556236.1 ABC transporter ATP-binding protein [Chelatococcus sp.]
MTLLSIRNLDVRFVDDDALGRPRVARALNDVSFKVERGEVLGLVGETGAGKSLTAQAVMGLLRPPARRQAGSICLDDTELSALGEEAFNSLRGTAMAMVVQSPKTSLDPLCRIGDQIVRIQRAHRPVERATARRRAVELLGLVGIPDPARRAQAWPHELSGGMAQRVLIAMALANDPRLLIADEPTTGLDVTVQTQILDLLRQLVLDKGMGLMIITHDLGVVAHYCDRVAVMFAGTIVESGPVRDILVTPSHPYTQALMAATPERIAQGQRPPAAGAPPDLFALPAGCVYQQRCRFADDICRTAPPSIALPQGGEVRCHHADRTKHG